MNSKIIKIWIVCGLLLMQTRLYAQTTLPANLNIQENDQWCWAACSKTVLSLYNKNLSQCEIAEYARTQITWYNFGSVNCCTDATKGCNYWNYNWGSPGSIADIISHYGQTSVNVSSSLTFAQANTEIINRKPFIVRWGWRTGGGHFVVGYGVNPATSSIYLMNPWPGEGKSIQKHAWVVDDGSHTWTHTNKLQDGTPIVTSVQDEEFKKIKIYPNPAADFVTVSSNNQPVEVYNLNGILIDTAAPEDNTNEVVLNVSSYNSGIYILKINQVHFKLQVD